MLEELGSVEDLCANHETGARDDVERYPNSRGFSLMDEGIHEVARADGLLYRLTGTLGTHVFSPFSVFGRSAPVSRLCYQSVIRALSLMTVQLNFKGDKIRG